MDKARSDRKMREPCTVCDGKGNESLLTMCMACYGSGAVTITCRQCWNKKPAWKFRNTRRPGFGKVCKECKATNRAGVRKDPRRGLPDKGALRVKLNVVSGNVKTGEVPVSMSSSPTCPPSCAHRGGACYAERHFVGMHWRRLSAGAGMTWDEFCAAIAALPEGQAWRHNEAGDLPGTGEEIDVALLEQLVEANRGRVGFTYTHKEVFADDGLAVSNRLAIMHANENGFTVNLSADGVEHADELLALGIGPVTVTLPPDAPKQFKTPGGAQVTVCPAQWSDTTCGACVLCARAKRKAVVGFWAHGPGKAKVGSTFQLPLLREMTRRRQK